MLGYGGEGVQSEAQLTQLEGLQRHVAALRDAADACERLWALATGTAPEQRAGAYLPLGGRHSEGDTVRKTVRETVGETQ